MTMIVGCLFTSDATTPPDPEVLRALSSARVGGVGPSCQRDVNARATQSLRRPPTNAYGAAGGRGCEQDEHRLLPTGTDVDLCPHNPKVVGSNPTPATNSTRLEALFAPAGRASSVAGCQRLVNTRCAPATKYRTRPEAVSAPAGRPSSVAGCQRVVNTRRRKHQLARGDPLDRSSLWVQREQSTEGVDVSVDAAAQGPVVRPASVHEDVDQWRLTTRHRWVNRVLAALADASAATRTGAVGPWLYHCDGRIVDT
jgi:hypothetical protein